ncbi:hypothetical protein C8Q78DRAFT_1144971 [Trametes maxima]|nr:hypothetical protein C8Q78DRAFT_1144971 [Trametes maxima]
MEESGSTSPEFQQRAFSLLIPLTPPSFPGGVAERLAWDVARGKIDLSQLDDESSDETRSISNTNVVSSEIEGSQLGLEVEVAAAIPPDSDSEHSATSTEEDDAHTVWSGSEPEGVQYSVDTNHSSWHGLFQRERSSVAKTRIPKGKLTRLTPADGYKEIGDIRCQGYTAGLMLGVRNQPKLPFSLLVDTGSNTSQSTQLGVMLGLNSWVLGENHCEIKPPPLSGWTSSDLHTPELDCYSWDEKRRSELEIGHQFGVAWALNRKLLEDEPDGLLAMGRLEHQNAFEYPDDVPLVPSFMKCLQRRLPKMHPMRSENFTLWFAIRPPPSAVPSRRIRGELQEGEQGESWVAYNEWPCPNIPNFSDPIPADALHPEVWALPLNKLTFYDFAGKRKGFPRTHEIVVRRTLPQSTPADTSQKPDVVYKPLPVLLDTGSSLSRVPKWLLEDIRRNVIGDLPVPRASDDTSSPKGPHLVDRLTTPNPEAAPVTKEATPATGSSEDTYLIPNDFPYSKAYVCYEFEGFDNRPVVVYGSLRPFLVARNPLFAGDTRERLIVQGSDNYAVFGLGFFQTMFVSLHQASGSMRDFVRLAQQNREGKKYSLPHPWNVPA